MAEDVSDAIDTLEITYAPELPNLPKAASVHFYNERVVFVLDNGGEISFPLRYFPRLQSATSEQRERWVIQWDGEAVRWPDIDEDVSVRVLLTGEG